MKTWTQQINGTQKLWGTVLSLNNENEIVNELINFKVEDINTKYGVLTDKFLPILFKL